MAATLHLVWLLPSIDSLAKWLTTRAWWFLYIENESVSWIASRNTLAHKPLCESGAQDHVQAEASASGLVAITRWQQGFCPVSALMRSCCCRDGPDVA